MGLDVECFRNVH